MLNYKHLHYFRTVAKTGATNRAADKLHLTPQTLSGQISAFETRLGVALFRRIGRRLELTDALSIRNRKEGIEKFDSLLVTVYIWKN